MSSMNHSVGFFESSTCSSNDSIPTPHKRSSKEFDLYPSEGRTLDPVASSKEYCVPLKISYSTKTGGFVEILLKTHVDLCFWRSIQVI